MATEENTNSENWMTPKDHRSKSHQYRRRSINEKAIEQVMRDWYGQSLGDFEIEQRQDKEKPLSEVMDDLLMGWQQEEKVHLRQIIQNWDKIIGLEYARSTRPRKLENGILDVDVFNPTVRYKLTLVKHVVQKQIQENCETEIKQVRFITAGQSSSRPNT